MTAIQNLKSHLVPGRLYRRSDIEIWSKAVDRHLSRLQKEEVLLKLSGGLYYCPKKTPFGIVPPNDADLISCFLKDDRFLVTSPNMYNTLEVGTTQLYNETIVYNHKRHGVFTFGSRTFKFVMRHHFPNEVSDEFLLIDLIDHLDSLPENRDYILSLAKIKMKTMNRNKLLKIVSDYGSIRSKKEFLTVMKDENE